MKWVWILLIFFLPINGPADEQSEASLTRAIVLMDHPDHLIKENLDHYEGIFFENLTLPGNPLQLKQILQQTVLNQPLTKETILRGEEAIIDFFNENAHPLVLVFTPNQQLSSGVVQMIVVESRIGSICYEGNQWFSDALLSQNFRLEEGGYYNSNYAKEDLIWLNRSPFRNSYLILDPGEEEGTTDITICTEDQFPYRFFVGSDNTGINATGQYRLFTGINVANLFGLDQSLSYQYTVGLDWGRFFAHGARYSIPLPWRNIVEFFGGYSGIRAIMPLDLMTHRGRAWQASMRYLIPLVPFSEYSHEFRFGIDYKQTDVNIVFGGVPILGNSAVISQILLGYSGAYSLSCFQTSFNLSFFYSPGQLFDHQSNRAYESLRPFAKSNYCYFRAEMTPIFHLPKGWDLVTRLDFQVANQNLLSSEQFGLGGLYTIRGYDERILNTDNALLLSCELRTFPMKLISRKHPELLEQLQFFGFVDYGFGTDHKPLPGIQNFRYLLSTGVGVVYFLDYHVNIRADWGYPIHRKIQPNVTQRHPKFNFLATLSF